LCARKSSGGEAALSRKVVFRKSVGAQVDLVGPPGLAEIGGAGPAMRVVNGRQSNNCRFRKTPQPLTRDQPVNKESSPRIWVNCDYHGLSTISYTSVTGRDHADIVADAITGQYCSRRDCPEIGRRRTYRGEAEEPFPTRLRALVGGADRQRCVSCVRANRRAGHGAGSDGGPGDRGGRGERPNHRAGSTRGDGCAGPTRGDYRAIPARRDDGARPGRTYRCGPARRDSRGRRPDEWSPAHREARRADHHH
jgi:hypothetical protein